MTEIVKGGKKFNVGPLTYRQGYDIVKLDNGLFYLSVRNGPFEIFKGPIRNTIELAESDGINTMLITKPRLARNIGLQPAQAFTTNFKDREIYNGIKRSEMILGCQNQGMSREELLKLSDDSLAVAYDICKRRMN